MITNTELNDPISCLLLSSLSFLLPFSILFQLYLLQFPPSPIHMYKYPIYTRIFRQLSQPPTTNLALENRNDAPDSVWRTWKKYSWISFFVLNSHAIIFRGFSWKTRWHANPLQHVNGVGDLGFDFIYFPFKRRLLYIFLLLVKTETSRKNVLPSLWELVLSKQKT